MAKTITQLPDATVVNAADELIIQQGGVTKRATKTEVLNGIVNANIDAAAAIAYSKLAALNSAQILVGNGSNVPTAVSVTGDVTISNAGVTTLARPYTLATAKASTSGTNIDFTGIPSWAKQITVMFDGVSTSGTSNHLIQLGDSGGIEATGYTSACTFSGATTGGTSATAGFVVTADITSTSQIAGRVVLSLVSGNTWVSSGSSIYNKASASAFTLTNSGVKTLSDVLDRVRITTVNGTDTFDAGSINIAYEG